MRPHAAAAFQREDGAAVCFDVDVLPAGDHLIYPAGTGQHPMVALQRDLSHFGSFIQQQHLVVSGNKNGIHIGRLQREGAGGFHKDGKE